MNSYNGSPISTNFDFSWNKNKGLNWMQNQFNSQSSTSSISNGSPSSTSTGSVGSAVSSVAARAGADLLSGQAAKLFGDSDIGSTLGNIFSTGISTSMETMADNVIKGNALDYGLGKNVGSAISGTAVGLAGNLVGQGIESIGGHSKLSKGLGAGVATGIGTVGGNALSKLVAGEGLKNMFSKGFLKNPSGMINPYALGMSVVGAGLGAALGPSKELAGKHGDITKGFDMAHNIISTGVNFIPGVGQFISGALALNKGLSNLFGSTDGMTKTDATLAGIGDFVAPVKWLNMANAKKTGTINNESWQKQEARDSFMQSSFGNIGDRIADAKEKAGKTYGTFSHRQYKNAQKDVAFADYAKSMLDDMTKQNEIQNIRSSAMTSVNNQRYQQLIQGGPRFSYIGRKGLKLKNYEKSQIKKYNQ